jgi:hypothetical protein
MEMQQDIFRINNRPISERQVNLIKSIKEKAQELINLVIFDNNEIVDVRMVDLFKSNLEQAVMWGVKSIT